MRFIALLITFATLTACGTTRDVGGGGIHGEVMVLKDAPAMELSMWDGAVLFDMRDFDDFVLGHVEGARRVSLEDLRAGRGLPDDTEVPVIFMGADAFDTTPDIAADIALRAGFEDIQIYQGGWADYQRRR
ncbi:rhodanese-like domain-containing protein [Planctomycetota bacterium]|nr:rhodanese-like domain-containing protein [Planctomycetota bacterium]